MADGVTYRSLHHVQFLDDQTEGRLGSMGHAERQVFEPRPFWKWWWQEGAVDNCCCCFPLRTGIVLLSLSNLLNVVLRVFVGSNASSHLAWLEHQYADMCSEEGDNAACKKLLESETEDEFVISCAPLHIVSGVVLLIFSVIGFRAACTGDSKSAKLYMKAFPFMMVSNVILIMMRVVIAPWTITWMMQVLIGVEMFLIAYYCKVTWSFYKRRKVMEDAQFTIDAPSALDTVSRPCLDGLRRRRSSILAIRALP